MVKVKIRPPWILFTCTPEEGSRHHMVSTSCKYDGTFKAFKAPFGARQLINLKTTYPNAQVIMGQEHIDKLKTEMVELDKGKEVFYHSLKSDPKELLKYLDCEDVMKGTPREVQIKGLAYLQCFKYGALFADCGAGKTNTVLWDIARKYKFKELRPSSVLVLGKLATLFTGWEDDTKDFTYLKSLVLWEESQPAEETITDEKIINDHGPKPRKGKGTKRRAIEYYHRSTGKRAILRSARKYDPKKHERKLRQWRQIGDDKYGEETLATLHRLDVRAESIRGKIFSHEHDIHILNHDGALQFEKELIERNYDMVVIDESTVIKNPKSKLLSAVKNIAKNARYRVILSGTPQPQGEQDLWGQFSFIDDGLTFGTSYKEFLQENFEVITLGSNEKGTYSGEKILPRKHGKNGKMGTKEFVQGRMNNRIFRARLKDCVDIPEPASQIIEVRLTSKLRKAYDQMKEEMKVELENSETVTAEVHLAKIMKLRQLASGFIMKKNEDGKGSKAIQIDTVNPKLEALKDLINEIPKDEKIVIFAYYKEEIKRILEYLGPEARAIYGGESDKKKLKAPVDFVHDPSVRFLVCQPASAAYGVNKLTVSRYMIFYSIGYEADYLYQAKHRIYRPGQTRVAIFYFLCSIDTIDNDVVRVVGIKELSQQKTININLIKSFKEAP